MASPPYGRSVVAPAGRVAITRPLAGSSYCTSLPVTGKTTAQLASHPANQPGQESKQRSNQIRRTIRCSVPIEQLVIGVRSCTVRSENPLPTSATGPNFFCKLAGWKMRPTMEMEGKQAGPQTTSPVPSIAFLGPPVYIPQLQAIQPTRSQASWLFPVDVKTWCMYYYVTSREKHYLPGGLYLQVPAIPSKRADKISIFCFSKQNRCNIALLPTKVNCKF